MTDQTPDPIDVSLHRAITVAVGGMLGYGPEPEIAKVALETIEAAGFRVVPIVDDATRQEVEAIEWALRHVPTAVGPGVRSRAAELLAAAYLGRND